MYFYCSITSDKGYEYSVQITGDPCSYTDDQQVLNDYEDEQENFTCPNCGDEKDEYDELCYNCRDIKEHTCPRCGQHDPYMYSTDDYCSDCEAEQRAEEGEEY